MSMIRIVGGSAIALSMGLSTTACADEASSGQASVATHAMADATHDAGQVAASNAKTGPITVYKTPT